MINKSGEPPQILVVCIVKKIPVASNAQMTRSSTSVVKPACLKHPNAKRKRASAQHRTYNSKHLQEEQNTKKIRWLR